MKKNLSEAHPKSFPRGRTLKTFLLIIISLPFGKGGGWAFSQNYCGSPRYDTEVFTNVTTSSNVIYGQNIDINGNTQILLMDVYEPTGDVAVKRPLIVFAHGGAFVVGSKTDSYCVDICTAFAKRGYVAVSIEYRMGMGFPITAQVFETTIWRAMQDMKAAIRFFRKDAATTNTYKIDPNYIFGGGASAGGITAVQVGYLDKSSEVPIAIDTTILGGLEGNSGSSGYSSYVNAIINYCGAVMDTSFILPGDKPMITAQGDMDEIVPYCSDMIKDLIGIPIMPMHGGGAMNIRAYHIGLQNPIHTFYGQNHISPSTGANLDTTILLTSDFLFQQLGCSPVNTIPYTNKPTCPGSPPPPPPTATSELIFSDENINLFPNPSRGEFQISSTKFQVEGVEVYDVLGNIIAEKILNSKFGTLNLNIASGIYTVKISSGENSVMKKLIIE